MMTLPTPDAAFRWTEQTWGPALTCVPLGATAQHVFTARQLQLRGGRGPTAPAWLAVLGSVGCEPGALVRVGQVHGRGVHVVRRGQLRELVSRDPPAADAIVSNQPGAALGVLVADCVPVLMADRRSGAAAAVHAGWRGTCAGVSAAAVDALAREFGTRPADLTVALGPSVGPDDYEVGAEVVAAFESAGYASRIDRWFRRRARRTCLDLWSANRDQLIAGGVSPERVFVSGLSTLRHPDLLASYRAHREMAGRMAAVIVVPSDSEVGGRRSKVIR
jgi:hypothetical protein